MHILAISGSIRPTSTTTTLVRAVIALAPATMRWTLYDGLGDLPHFVPDLDGDTPPAPVVALRELLAAADGVLICTPEYAHGMPGSLKNALDWAVSSGEFVGKPVAALSASPSIRGGDRAHASLVEVITVLSAIIPDGASLTIPTVRKKLGADGAMTDNATTGEIRAALDALAGAVAEGQGW